MAEENNVNIEEEKTQEQLDKEEKKAKMFFIGFFVVVAFIIVGILVYGHIEKKRREERLTKSLSGLPSVMQETVDEFNEKVDQIMEDMKNDPKLK